MRLHVAALLAVMISCSPALAGGHADYGDSGMDMPDVSAHPFSGNEDRPFTIGAARDPNGDGSPMMIAISRPPEGDFHWADVIFKNRLAYGPATPTEYHFEFDGKVVYVYFQGGNGDVPDTLSVIPPDGYIAIPSEITVEENEEGLIQIFPALLG
jgi:hypothetical protein